MVISFRQRQIQPFRSHEAKCTKYSRFCQNKVSDLNYSKNCVGKIKKQLVFVEDIFLFGKYYFLNIEINPDFNFNYSQNFETHLYALNK